MMCESCGKGQMEPTQVPRVSERALQFGYVIAIGGMLAIGVGVGHILSSLFGDDGVDLSLMLITIPAVLLVCTPIVVVGALRISSEKNVWRCASCGHSFDGR